MPVFLSKNLTYLRKLKSFTQKDMAEKLGVTPSAYGNYENDYSQPNYEILEAMTKILVVNAQDLLFSDLQEDGKPEPDTRLTKKKEQTAQELPITEIMKLIEALQKQVDEIKKQVKKGAIK